MMAQKYQTIQREASRQKDIKINFWSKKKNFKEKYFW